MSIRAFKNVKPKIGNGVHIDESAVIIGDVTIGNHVSIWPGTVIRGDVHKITIGNDTNIQDGCILHVSHAGRYSTDGHPLNIGKGVTIGHRAMVHGCTIADTCLIGIGSIIMDGSIVEEKVMLGAGALVPPGKVLKSGNLYVGSPAKIIRKLSNSELDFLTYSYQHYKKLKDDYINDNKT